MPIRKPPLASSGPSATPIHFTAAPRQANSRLSCQIQMCDVLDGIAVRIADRQV